MKKPFVLILLTLLTASFGVQAQEFKTKFPNRQDRKVVVEMQGSDVTVEGYDGDELVIRGNGFEAPPKMAQGLRPVYNTAQDNTQIGLSVTPGTGANTLRVVKASRKEATYTIRVPRRTAVVFTETNWGSGDLVIRDTEGSIEANLKSGDIKLLNVSGPVVANSISGDVTIRFSSLRPEPSSVSVVSGDLDVSLPTSSKVSLTLRSISGEIYTDFDMSLSKGTDNMNRVGGQTVSGTINGGGPAMSLKTISGDIFVRKAK
jgi:lia operon protein LiaG